MECKEKGKREGKNGKKCEEKNMGNKERKGTQLQKKSIKEKNAAKELYIKKIENNGEKTDYEMENEKRRERKGNTEFEKCEKKDPEMVIRKVTDGE